jgi:FkbM family methyltransferase
MNLIRKIYPLWLRSKIYFHLISHTKLITRPINNADLELAPAKMTSLLSSDYGHRQIAWLGYYELEMSRKIASFAKQGGLLIDVGANAGYFSCLWSALNGQNEAYAFEPSPRNLVMLRHNLAELGSPNRVRVFDCALGRESTTLGFDVGPEEQSGWGGLSSSDSVRTIPVKVCRLDELISEGKSISVLKIDTEGADTWVLLGAESLLKQRRIKHIFFEKNLQRMGQLGILENEAEDFLARLGYKVHHLEASDFYATW